MINKLLATTLAWFMLSNVSYAETLLKDSIVCWSEDDLERFIVADEDTKEHMEEHECLVWYKDMAAQLVLTRKVTISGKSYSISNIVLRYEYYGERADNVWTFASNLSDSLE